jgi:hypothetical protein
VEAWTDLWFYSNPVYIEVKGSYDVAGVKSGKGIRGDNDKYARAK